MPKFITIGYGDQAGYDRTPEAIRRPPTTMTPLSGSAAS